MLLPLLIINNLILGLRSLSTGKICIINCEDKKAWSPISFSDMFMNQIDIGNNQWSICNIAKGDSLPIDIHSYQGIILTGSHYNCRNENMQIPWFAPLFEVIRSAYKTGHPNIYGSCFGAQLIAR
eukprot:gene17495-36000_t